MCAHCSWNCSRYSCSLTRNYKIYISYICFCFYLNLHIVHFSTKRRELRHRGFWNIRHTLQHRLFQIVHLGAASSICIYTVHFSMKRRELRHEDFWNTRHTPPRHLFQNVHLSAASPIYVHIVHFSTSIQSISPRITRSFLTNTFEKDGTLRRAVCFKLCIWAMRRQYKSMQSISPRSAGNFVTKTFETHGTQRRAVCFKMGIPTLCQNFHHLLWLNRLWILFVFLCDS